MMKQATRLIATALMGASVLPVGAALAAPGPSSRSGLVDGTALVQLAQLRDERRDLRRERRDVREERRDVRRARRDLRDARRDVRVERRYYVRNGRRYYRDASGAEIFAGLVAGALAAGAAAAAQGADAVAYCESRFRSYDRATGTYLGYDGLRHPCP